ncbi:undecaprenyldiphospho-muramoylpentapeptide beta-N-acetylglucosaminyltransferase [Tessaracoccus flavus]|uniref:UDP-N-acetylglucosamine--N-acetylmuramyl-(pentapeptide) pyrophosphoryl-undecaprenol N-acetylglucosamine transferase n=1 Tax=Tessaracoccus flavus TaxID=1610493 RepID=A0A1Q2CD82_9ACTN|nr:undecaprenyldiphospho-muramoylpentapeptide beta-N-acetylglucosaminyltransferase [Tessaracoccus flavus]AQP44083.1 undecaprenyldiphospho-muramoylpentapeptide beta-N-acetylglucosaminyltransferase [Tessaracoccus flavus]SDY34335.1 UDP-N-acetylglucosamine-N-acetylmuramylpentapeptide N-acetylglucosamine transferase [Tessaracoccus flavus]
MTSVVLAGGGTAGHTSPLIATAKAILARRPDASILCIGTAKGLETRVIPEAGLELRLITPAPLPRSVNLDLVKLPYTLTRSTREARRLLREAKADVLVGFGGYVSIPAYLAARMSGVPVVVHEANKLVGVANKVGARWAHFVGTTFEETTLPGARLIGMPISASITHPKLGAAQARESFGLDPERSTLLVSGGSQGARSINEAVAGAREAILTAGIQILHVLGPKNFGSEHVVVEHDNGARYRPVAFVDDMAVAYAAADLMLGRAGAGTVMETAVSGLPVIFVPWPYGNGEQARNAAGLVAAGAGVMVEDGELTADKLERLVVDLCADPDRLAAMSQAARGMYPSDAAETLAEAVLAAAAKERLS